MGVLGVVLEVVRGDDELTCSRAPNDDDDVIALVILPLLTAWCGVLKGRVEILGAVSEDGGVTCP